MLTSEQRVALWGFDPEAPTSRGTRPTPNHEAGASGSAIERARRYVERMEPAVAGSGGHQATWRVAQVLVRGFGLPRLDAEQILGEYNARCQPSWSKRELAHKLASAEKRSRMPRGYLLEGGRDRGAGTWGEHCPPDWDAQPPDGQSEGPVEEARGTRSAASPEAPSFAFPAPDDEPALWKPTATIPEPASWTVSTEDRWKPDEFRQLDTERLTDISVQGIAERVFAQVQHHFDGFAHDAGSFWLFDGRVWRELPHYWIEQTFSKFHHRCTHRTELECAKSDRSPKVSELFDANPRSIKAATERLRSMLEADQRMPVGVSYFDDSPSLAAFTNGTLVLERESRDVKLKPNAAEHRALHGFAFDYQSGLEPTHLLRVMHQDWFGGLEEGERDARIEALRQFAGHCMLGSQSHTNQHRALMLVGRGGDGKSTFIELVRSCMPPGSHCALQPSEMSSGAGGGELARAALFGKWANLVEDVSSAAISNTAALKTTIGFGEVQARRIGGNPFTFRSKATQVYSANELPKVADRTRGFLRRWLLVEFPNCLDPRFFDGAMVPKILAHEHRELVCWAIDAAVEQLSKGTRFVEPACHSALLTKWAAGDDSVANFIEGATEPAGPNKDGWTPVADLYREYEAWCQFVYGAHRARQQTESKDRFAKTLQSTVGCECARRGKGRTRVIDRKVVKDA